MSDKAHKPYVPDDSTMSEFTLRALVLGLVMCVILGPPTPTSACARA